jgi:hypothetical protein
MLGRRQVSSDRAARDCRRSPARRAWGPPVVQVYVALADALLELMQGGQPTLPSMADMAQVVIRESA